MGRVSGGELKLKDAAAMLHVSYRQAKRVWRRYREVGHRELQHGNAGRASHRSKPTVLPQNLQLENRPVSNFVELEWLRGGAIHAVMFGSSIEPCQFSPT